MKKACPFTSALALWSKTAKHKAVRVRGTSLGQVVVQLADVSCSGNLTPDSHRWKPSGQANASRGFCGARGQSSSSQPRRPQVSLPSSVGPQVSVSLSLSPSHVGPQDSVVSPLSLSHRHVGTQVSVVSPLSLFLPVM